MKRAESAAALGHFDGVHAGHRAVIEKAVNSGLLPAVFTFERADKTDGSRLILSAEDKRGIIAGLGVKLIYTPDFTDVRDMTPRDFIKEILVNQMNAARVVCGEDFRFGKGAAAGTLELRALCGEFGIGVCVVPPVLTEEGEKISSTMIRRLITKGDIKCANRLLSSEFRLNAPVENGRKVGRLIDFPTVNQLYPENRVLPRLGVYASVTELDGKKRRSITNIGVKPTVQARGDVTAETHIIGFDGDLYGRTVSVVLIDFIRDEMKFTSLEQLAEQIKSDIRSRERMD